MVVPCTTQIMGTFHHSEGLSGHEDWPHQYKFQRGLEQSWLDSKKVKEQGTVNVVDLRSPPSGLCYQVASDAYCRCVYLISSESGDHIHEGRSHTRILLETGDMRPRPAETKEKVCWILRVFEAEHLFRLLTRPNLSVTLYTVALPLSYAVLGRDRALAGRLQIESFKHQITTSASSHNTSAR